jgi:DNA-binding response OmpR family regulator
MRILVVEDNAEMQALVETSLRQEGHHPSAVATRADAERALQRGGFAGAILDWMLPDGSGIDLCRWMREIGDETPVLMLTARGGVDDRVTGLNAGADDYLRKPFAAAELKARVRALLRRGPRLADPVVRIGPVEIHFGARRVLSSAQEVILTEREFAILEALARANGRVLPRSSILLSVWGVDDASASGSLEVLIARLRRKLSAAGAPDAIRTMRGVGYMLQSEP